MDNFFQNCPPMMEDGFRQLTDYKTSTRRNEYIKYINDIWRDDQYRLFLQLNGQQIMDREWKYHKENNSCRVSECVHNYPTRVNNRLMWQERQIHDSQINPCTNEKLAKMRQCHKFQDYRLNP